MATFDPLMVRLIYAQRRPVVGKLAKLVLRLFGIHVPVDVRIGRDLKIPHSVNGVVINDKTTIGDRVTIYHHVTIGRGDGYIGYAEDYAGTVIEDDVVLCVGAVVLGANGEPLRIGRGTVVGANAVLTQSTGEWEIWAGNPARKVRDRDDVGVPQDERAA